MGARRGRGAAPAEPVVSYCWLVGAIGDGAGVGDWGAGAARAGVVLEGPGVCAGRCWARCGCGPRRPLVVRPAVVLVLGCVVAGSRAAVGGEGPSDGASRAGKVLVVGEGCAVS